MDGNHGVLIIIMIILLELRDGNALTTSHRHLCCAVNYAGSPVRCDVSRVNQSVNSGMSVRSRLCVVAHALLSTSCLKRFSFLYV